MSSFDYAGDHFDVRDLIADLHRASWQQIGSAGAYWTGAERVEIARQARAARAARTDPPWARGALPDPEVPLSDAAIEAARTIAADAHKIDRAWAEQVIESLGDAPYVELGSVVATVSAIDAFGEALGRGHEPLPTPEPGEPTGERLAEAGEAGAYIPMMVPWQGPNVGRALSLVPSANRLFMQNVMAMYSAGESGGFYDLDWAGPLTRAQAELVAARVSAVNECFY